MDTLLLYRSIYLNDWEHGTVRSYLGHWTTAVLISLTHVEYVSLGYTNQTHEQLPLSPRIYSLVLNARWHGLHGHVARSYRN